MNEQSATLIAAVIAAVATSVSAVIAAHTARRVSGMQPAVEQLRRKVAEGLAFASFRRERLSACLDTVSSAYDRLFELSEMVGRKVWIEGPQQQVTDRVRMGEQTLHECTSRIETAVSTLGGFQVLPEPALTDWLERIESVRVAWGFFMGEAIIHVPGMAERYAPSEPDSREYHNRWGDLQRARRELGALVHALPAQIERHERVPEPGREQSHHRRLSRGLRAQKRLRARH